MYYTVKILKGYITQTSHDKKLQNLGKYNFKQSKKHLFVSYFRVDKS